MELFSLSIPWILALFLVLSLGLLLVKKWKIAVVLLLLVLIANWHVRCLPVNIGSSSLAKEQTLSVLTFNCNMPLNQGNDSQKRNEIANLIIGLSPDVVFLTENYVVKEDTLWHLLHDKYLYHTQQENGVGNTLYSKYPIFNNPILNGKHTKHCTINQIDFNGKLVIVYGIHLVSNNYNDRLEYMTPDSISSCHEIKTYLKNIMSAGSLRQEEALEIVEDIENKDATIPIIVMGDFNDVSGAPTLNILESAGLKDAWWEGGLGYGATIHHPLPYRIDHIMYNDRVKLKRINKVDAEGLSDHDALMAEFWVE